MVMTLWQSIETAPKDGTWILICERTGVAPDVHVVRWNDAERSWATMPVGPTSAYTYDADPEYWMPLPEPASEGAKMENRPTDWRPGDIIISDGIRREIVDVRATGYGWKYPDFGECTPTGGENYWWSENSSDPFLELGWIRDGSRGHG